MIKLPTEKVKAVRKDPRNIVLFGQPKIGKSTLVSGLDNCLIIDLEDGTQFVDALKYNVIGEATKQDKLPIIILKQLINKIAEENKKQNKKIYKYIAIDTVTALEDIVLPLAGKMYQETPMGRNWVGKDVTTLPNGAGS